MLGSRRTVGSLVGVLFMYLAWGADAQSSPHVDDANHFSAQVPDGWYPIQPSLIETLDQQMDEQVPNKRFRYVGGYSTSLEGAMTYPYVLFQVTNGPMNRTTEAELVRSFNAKTWKEDVADRTKALSNLKDFDLEAAYDPVEQRIVMPISGDVPGIGPLRGLSVGHVGSHGIVQINCYAQATEFDAVMPTFQKWIDGMEIDADYRWEPGSAGPVDWQEVGWVALIGAIAGGLYGLFVARRRRSAKE